MTGVHSNGMESVPSYADWLRDMEAVGHVVIAPGEVVLTPERAEELGLTADARRMRRRRDLDRYFRMTRVTSWRRHPLRRLNVVRKSAQISLGGQIERWSRG